MAWSHPFTLPAGAAYDVVRWCKLTPVMKAPQVAALVN